MLVDLEKFNEGHARKNIRIIESVAGKMLQISNNNKCANNSYNDNNN